MTTVNNGFYVVINDIRWQQVGAKIKLDYIKHLSLYDFFRLYKLLNCDKIK